MGRGVIMKMICLACYASFIYTNHPFKDYPYCPCCGSGNTAWVGEGGELNRNN